MIPIILMLVQSATQPAAPPADPLVDAVARCLAIERAIERLACLDPAARALVDAAGRRDVVVVKRADIVRTRRSLFGLGGEPADILTGGGAPAAERIEVLETTLAAAAPIGNERWSVRLEEGGRWQTTEPWALGTEPRRGAAATVRRGTLGSYLLKIPGARAVRVRRID